MARRRACVGSLDSRRAAAPNPRITNPGASRAGEARDMSARPPITHAGRRDLIKAGLAAGAAALVPWKCAHAGLPQIGRERTMILVWGGREGRWVDWDLWNPYSIGSNHQNGPNLVYEPLAYYSAFADKTHMWLAESYEFTPDFKRLTIRTRPGISWSDGVPFGAEDVAYTLTTLRA